MRQSGTEIRTWMPKPQAATIIVAASNSLHPERADYVCPGAADDVVLQAAIDALPSGGGWVSVMEGSYNTSNPVLPCSNLKLSGYGATITLANGSDCNMINLPSDCENIVIEGFIFDGNGTNQAASSSNIIGTLAGAGTPTNITIHGNYFKNAEYTCFNMDNVYDSLVKNNRFLDPGYVGLRMHATNKNHIISNTFDGFVYAAIVMDGRYDVVSDNTIRNVSAIADVPAIRIIPNGTVEQYGLRISKNTFIADYPTTAQTGVSIESDYLIDAEIEGNMFYKCHTGVTSTGGGIGLSIIGNSFLEGHTAVALYDGQDRSIINNNRVADQFNGLILRDSHGSTIADNILYKIHYRGLKVEGATHLSISNNIFEEIAHHTDNLVPIIDTLAYGGTECDYISIIGNICFSGHANTPSYFYENSDDGDYNTIVGNTVKNCHAFANNLNMHDVSYDRHTDLFMDVLAVSATHVRSNEDLSEAIPNTFTIDAQPDVPRTLSGHFDAHANITAYTIDIVGVDAKGNTVTETKTEADGWDWETSNAFATITSIIMSARTGTGATDTMDIGITDVLGLSNTIYATGDVFKIKKNTTNATVAGAQVNTTYGTYDMSVITLGAGDDFTIWYKSNLNTIS